MSYGIPYMGSKSGIAKEVCKVFPDSENFYDLFGGGFSITHAMLLHRSKSYKHFHFNEIRLGICDLIKKAINGDYNYKNFKPEFITREEFFKRKEKDAYIKMCWSFGNSGGTYLFSEEIEPYKKSMHNAVVFNTFDDLAIEVLGIKKFSENASIYSRRLFLRNKIEKYRKTKIPDCLIKYLSKNQLRQLQQLERLQQLEQLQQLQQLQQLEQLQRLQQLQQLERLTFYNLSYEEVEIKPNSVVYCDIPYKNTASYDGNKNFNHDKFFDWAHKQQCPVFISEYNISDERFKLIKGIKKISLLDNSKSKKAYNFEKIYINKYGYDKLKI
jgi:hypothetical protein